MPPSDTIDPPRPHAPGPAVDDDRTAPRRPRWGGLVGRTDGRLSLTARFAMLAAVATAALGVVLQVQLGNTIERRALAESIRAGELVERLGIEPYLEVEDLDDGLTASRMRFFDDLMAKAIADSALERIKIFNREAEIVYSDDHAIIGDSAAGQALVEDALDGRSGSKLVTFDADHQRERGLGSLLEVFAPIRADVDGVPTVVGVAELYLSYGAVERAVGQDTRQLALLLGFGLLVLYLVLYRVVRNASRELERRAAQNEYLAQHDLLTGLPNRGLLFERTEHALTRVARDGGNLAVMLIDLDGFKEINDTLGHRAGDLLLVEVGQRFRRTLRATDTVARLGGDEFAVLLEDTDTLGAATTAARLMESLAQPISLAGVELAVRASVGLAIAPDDGDEPVTLLQRADVAMYLAKDAGGGVEVYQSSRDPHTEEQLRTLSDLRIALERDTEQIAVHFQPKADAQTGVIVGVEALVRWTHPERGPVPPDAFISVAERTDLIGLLTDRVLNESLRVVAALDIPASTFTVSINISARNLLERDLVARVESAVRRWGVEPSQIQFELTETALMSDPARAFEVLGELHDMGIGLSIDDFGTGYSSLAYLQQLPVDELKIDRSFVRSLAGSVGDQLIVRSTIDLARNLGLHTVAEGVEDEASWSLLRDLGCEVIQGYYLARPMPEEDLADWLANARRAAVEEVGAS